jgi:hypothetical protein
MMRRLLAGVLVFVAPALTVVGLMVLVGAGSARLWGVPMVLVGLGLLALWWLLDGRRDASARNVTAVRHLIGSLSAVLGGVLAVVGVIWVFAATGGSRGYGVIGVAGGIGLLVLWWRTVGRYDSQA